jgi:hypothetical protein
VCPAHAYVPVLVLQHTDLTARPGPAGKVIKACFGTTKYCNAFLKGVPCNNPDCLYLHDIGKLNLAYVKTAVGPPSHRSCSPLHGSLCGTCHCAVCCAVLWRVCAQQTSLHSIVVLHSRGLGHVLVNMCPGVDSPANCTQRVCFKRTVYHFSHMPCVVLPVSSGLHCMLVHCASCCS